MHNLQIQFGNANPIWQCEIRSLNPERQMFSDQADHGRDDSLLAVRSQADHAAADKLRRLCDSIWRHNPEIQQ